MLNSDSIHKKYQANTTSKYPNNPEQTMWLRRTKNGDSTAFSYIAEKYQQPVYNLCYRMLSNADDAEDAAQEAFIRAYSKLDTYDDTAKFSTWLFSIASHYCIDKLRRRRFQLVSWDDLAPWHLFPGQDVPQPESALLDAEATREVRILLGVLPPDYRTVIILKYWHALSYQEIAQTLETTVSAIKSKLFRARKMMATQITTGQAVTPRPEAASTLSRMVFNSPLKMAQLEVI
jgi:RNA polymerase sigma-70 factor (ECF subfamily)